MLHRGRINSFDELSRLQTVLPASAAMSSVALL